MSHVVDWGRLPGEIDRAIDEAIQAGCDLTNPFDRRRINDRLVGAVRNAHEEQEDPW